MKTTILRDVLKEIFLGAKNYSCLLIFSVFLLFRPKRQGKNVASHYVNNDNFQIHFQNMFRSRLGREILDQTTVKAISQNWTHFYTKHYLRSKLL